MCHQMRTLFDRQLNNNFSRVNTLLGCGQYSMLQDLQQHDKKLKLNDSLPKSFLSKYQTNTSNRSINILTNLNERQLNTKLSQPMAMQPEIYKSSNAHKRILGHLSAVYCVIFDRTGRYIITVSSYYRVF